MNKRTIVVLLFSAFLFRAGAQVNVADVARKFDAYQAVWPKTKLHLLFTQDRFVPGDTAYFKAYFVGQDIKSIAGKQLINFQLVDSAGNSKLQFLFGVMDGVGYNQFSIPSDLPAGVYLATAYSTWMKNFDPSLIFQKRIFVVRKHSLVLDDKAGFRAFVEGGHLIRDISSKVIVKSKPSSSVRIVDGTGREISQGTADTNGLTSLIFTPERGVAYFAEAIGTSERVSLPVTQGDGCGLRVIPAVNDGSIKVLATIPPNSTLRDEKFTLIISSHGKIVKTLPVAASQEGTSLTLAPADLPDGVCQASLLNHAGELVASRDFFSSSGTAIQAKVQAVRRNLYTREKVRLEVSVTDNNGQALQGEFSIRVLNGSLFEGQKENSLSDALGVLSGPDENIHIDRLEANGSATMDNYLITVTKEIPWNSILSNNAGRPKFLFTGAIQKSGTAYFADTNLPVPEFTQIMFYLQRAMLHYQILTSAGGKVGIAIPDVYGDDEFFYMAETRGKPIPSIKIVWDEESMTLPHAPSFHETTIEDAYGAFAFRRNFINRSYGFYASTQRNRDSGNLSGSQFEDEITGADVSVNVQNYILFPSMEELVKEVIPSLFSRKTNKGPMVRVTLPEPMQVTGDPVYIIDGIATRNSAFFLSLIPADLLTVKLVTDPKKLLRWGLMGKNGFVLVQTKKGDVREPVADLSKLIEGLNKPIDFGASTHAGAEDVRKPDFRSTIFWNPIVKTDAAGKAIVEFYCSDDTGKLNVYVDGRTAGDVPFSTKEELEVGGSGK